MEEASERLDSAHETWDRSWRDPVLRAGWAEPDPAVSDLIPWLRERGVRRAADVGTGIGRHAVPYAAAGLEVVAIDASPAGITELGRAASAAGVTIDARVATFTTLPLADDDVDHVLAWNVLYHGDGDVVRTAFQECRRVLRPGGTFQLTMLSKRNHHHGRGRMIRPDTYVDETSESDKTHPHFYVDGRGLAELLADTGFEIVSLLDIDQEPPGGYHWVVLAEAR